MIWVKKTPLLVLACLILWSCGFKKEAYQELKEVLIIKEAYVQEEVPGMQSEKTKHYLNIHLSNESYLSYPIDSIVAFGGTYTSAGKKQNLKSNPLQIQLGRFFIDDDKSTLQAKIFFKKDEKPCYQIVNDILIKEPIYLP